MRSKLRGIMVSKLDSENIVSVFDSQRARHTLGLVPDQSLVSKHEVSQNEELL